MRIAKLDLLAYGPFRGLELDLSAPGVHVVFGRNEAGKSTTLRAITGLLYGIDVRTKDAHVHKPGDLRIGGTLVAREGTRVRIVRRKGAANTLLDDAGQPIDEAVLVRALHGVSKETFENAFGLDLFSLQGGGKALLDGKGDIGGSLFDASAGGGVDAQRVLAELTDEAEKLYKPRAPTSELAIALKAFEQARKAIQEKERLPEGYTRQVEALRTEKAEREQKMVERAALVLRKTQLDRIKNRLPRERKKKELVAKLDALGPLVKHRPRIESLHARLGAYEIATKDRGAFAAEAESLRGQVAEAARRAGVAVDPRTGGVTSSPLVDERTAKRIQTLVSEGTKLAGAIDRARDEIDRSERELARARAAATPASDAALADSLLAALQGALERARALGDAKGRIAAENAKVAKRKAEVDARVTALRAFVKPAEELVAMKLPVAETIERLAERAKEIDKALERLAVRDQEAEAKERALERQIAASSGDFAPPDKAVLDAARRARDAALGALRDARAKKALDAATLVALEADLERALREADAVADRMIADADRVTALARFRAEHANYGKERAEWRAEREKAAAKRAALDEEHAKLWSPAAITPLGFAEMLAWLERHAQVVESFERLREARVDASEIEAAMAAARSELASAMVSAGVLVAPNATLGDLVDAATARVERVVTSRRTAVDAAKAIEKHAIQLEERRATSARDESSLAENRAKLKELSAPLGLPEDATGDEIQHALDARKDLSALEEKRAAVAARAALAETDARSFEDDAAKCAGDLATDLVGLSAREVTTTLVARSNTAHAHEQELSSIEQELAELGEHSIPDDLAPIAEDPSLLERAIEELDAQLEEIDAALSRLTQSIGGHEMGMQLMQGDTGAAEAAAAAQEALARVRSLAERYARSKVAAVILAREIERYREQNQGPLLQTASKLFARLTLGAYSGVRAAFDDKDRHTLHCVRTGNVDVDIDGLSEGTRDQLYLSLRLASLLRHCETAEPMPIILDDVLVQFDDERSRAALSVFAEVSEKLQVLFFTHHARHVELAREAIGTDRLTVHELAPIGAVDGTTTEKMGAGTGQTDPVAYDR